MSRAGGPALGAAAADGGERRVERLALAALRAVVALGCFITALLLGADPPAGARRDVVPDARLVASLRHLYAELEDGAAADMQALFPRGLCSRTRSSACRGCALAAVDSDEGRAPFPRDQNPPGGAFHAGWSAYAGQVAAASHRPTEARAFAARCQRLGAALDSLQTPFPPSCPGSAWPADAAVGAAALALHVCAAIRPDRSRGGRAA